MLNLLSNAFKFTFEGAITIGRRRDGGTAAHVADTGTGIAAAELPHLFERFHRVEAPAGAPSKAAASAWRSCASWSGSTAATSHVESAPGQGSTFTRHDSRARPDHVRRTRATAAPALRESESDARAPRPASRRRCDGCPPRVRRSARSWRQPAQRARPRMVVADDNADMRDYVVDCSSRPWGVEAVADGEAALAAFATRAARIWWSPT